ncbi:29740_t:CDS:1, partial [Gigaspora margarita]
FPFHPSKNLTPTTAELGHNQLLHPHTTTSLSNKRESNHHGKNHTSNTSTRPPTRKPQSPMAYTTK